VFRVAVPPFVPVRLGRKKGRVGWGFACGLACVYVDKDIYMVVFILNLQTHGGVMDPMEFIKMYLKRAGVSDEVTRDTKVPPELVFMLNITLCFEYGCVMFSNTDDTTVAKLVDQITPPKEAQH